MDASIGQILIMTVTVMIIGIVISNQFIKLRESTAVEAKSSSAIMDMVSEYDDPWKQSYEGLIVSGAEVNDEIKKCIKEGDYSVFVTGKSLADILDDGYTYGPITLVGTEQQLADACFNTGCEGLIGVYKYTKTGGSDWTLAVNGSTTSVSKGGPGTSRDNIDMTGTYKGYIYRDQDDVIRVILFVKQ